VSTAGRVATVIFALLAFACAFAGVAVGLDVTQPSARHSTATVQFEVRAGDTTAAVAARLEKQGLIRNAQLFRLLARFRHLDTALEPGIYQLSPDMTMDAIIQKLRHGQPDEQLITIPPGHRVTEYPAYFTALPNFDAKGFLKIVTTGVLPDGTKLSDKYWYLPAKGQNVAFALEGYLFADTYYFNTADTEVAVVERLLDALGEQLCKGPDDAHLDVYIHNAAQCKQHARQVGPKNNENIFTDMEKQFSTTDDRMALYDTLTLSSIVIREAGQNVGDIPAVADIYYNRYILYKAANPYVTQYGETIVSLDADPTAQYARDTDNPPDTSKGGKWWTKLSDAAKNVDPNNPYNTANPDHKGLPPGPIAAPRWDDIRYVAAADEPPSPYYYFVDDCHGQIYLGKTSGDQAANIQKANSVKCS
jgi:UPF0755 protein